MKRAFAVVSMFLLVAVGGGCGKSSTLKSPSGNLYHAGQMCPKKDKGMTTKGSGGKIKCKKMGNYYMWTKG